MHSTSVTSGQQFALRFGTWDKSGKLRYSNRVLAVSSIEDASAKWCAIRDAQGFTASNCPIVLVVNTDTAESIAKISYNGRAWDNDGAEIELPTIEPLRLCSWNRPNGQTRR